MQLAGQRVAAEVVREGDARARAALRELGAPLGDQLVLVAGLVGVSWSSVSSQTRLQRWPP